MSISNESGDCVHQMSPILDKKSASVRTSEVGERWYGPGESSLTADRVSEPPSGHTRPRREERGPPGLAKATNMRAGMDQGNLYGAKSSYRLSGGLGPKHVLGQLGHVFWSEDFAFSVGRI